MGSEKGYQKWLNDTTKHCNTDGMVAKIRQQAAEINDLKETKNIAIEEAGKWSRMAGSAEIEIEQLKARIESLQVDIDADKFNQNILMAKIRQLKKCVLEWMLHHWGQNDHISGAAHCCQYCWDLSSRTIDAKNDIDVEAILKAYIDRKTDNKEIVSLKACIQDARSLLVDYDGYETAEGLKTLIDQVDMILRTYKPMNRISIKKAGE